MPSAPPLDPIPDLLRADVAAFSIDDSTTIEIDDAFSVTALPDGGYRIGIHIAAPALGFTPGSPLDELARQRLSTVYMPGDKITMLPPNVVKASAWMRTSSVPRCRCTGRSPAMAAIACSPPTVGSSSCR